MNVQLEVSHSQANVRCVVLRSDTVIGRAPECNLRIASNEVSRRHCKIILSGDAVLVRDLGSSNGTFIDGVQLEPELDVAVAPGSQLSVGGVKFIVHVHNNPEETIRADDPAGPPAASHAPATEWLGSSEPVAMDLEEDLTVLEPLSDVIAAAPAEAPGTHNPAEAPSGDDLHRFLSQFEPNR